MTRLTQADLDAFLTQVAGECGATLEKGPSLNALGYRLWLTLLDDAAGGSLRVRKLTMALIPEAGSTLTRRSREWFSTHPTEDRWTEIDCEQELAAAELLAVIKAEFLRHTLLSRT